VLVLVGSFFAVALLYAMVGFGGGSSYVALLASAQTPYVLIPKVGLICNLLVVTGGCWFFFRRGHFSRRLIIPFIISSVPFAFLGGLFPIKERAYLLLLSTCLIGASIRILIVKEKTSSETRYPSTISALAVGSTLGFISGMVGIGGGIFLAPIMLGMKWGLPKQIAATASVFILVNSLAGLAGQFVKDPAIMYEVAKYYPLFLAVIIGGLLGSALGTHSKVPQTWIKNATAVLILFIGAQLLFRAW
jgi:uncharacterized membrane protein YfcA